VFHKPTYIAESSNEGGSSTVVTETINMTSARKEISSDAMAKIGFIRKCCLFSNVSVARNTELCRAVDLHFFYITVNI
jgi:hypothetical protein